MSATRAQPYRTQNWTLTKPSAAGRHGIVVSQNREAAEAGAAVLEAGGNAADAAVATAFALAAVEPWNSGLGGIGFALVLPAGESRAKVVDFGPVSPHRTDPADYPLTGATKSDLFTWPEVVEDRNIHGPLSFCVPSSVAGYGLMRERFGTGMAASDLLAPAIALARRGLAQDWYTTLKIASSAPVLRRYEESARIYLPGGLSPTPPYQGATGFFRLGELGRTLERLAAAGLQDFYEGAIAADLVADIAALGGVVDAQDLAALQGGDPRLAHPVLARHPPGAHGRRPHRGADARAGHGHDGDARAVRPARCRVVRAAVHRDARRLRVAAGGARRGRRRTRAGRHLHHPLHRGGPRRDARVGHHHAALLHGEPGRAAQDRRADE